MNDSIIDRLAADRERAALDEALALETAAIASCVVTLEALHTRQAQHRVARYLMDRYGAA